MTKIRTADCVKAIVEHFKDRDRNEILSNPKNWKRTSKRGNKTNGFLREFRNTKDKIIKVIVKSTDTEILNVSHFEKSTKFAFINSGIIHKSNLTPIIQTGLLEFCRKTILEMSSNYLSCHDLLHALKFENLPIITYPPEETDMIDEEVDFENCGIISLNDSVIKLWAGGDWQEPVEFTATLKDGKLVCNNDAVDANCDEMKTKEMIKIVFGNENHPSLNNFHIADY